MFSLLISPGNPCATVEVCSVEVQCGGVQCGGVPCGGVQYGRSKAWDVTLPRALHTHTLHYPTHQHYPVLSLPFTVPNYPSITYPPLPNPAFPTPIPSPLPWTTLHQPSIGCRLSFQSYRKKHSVPSLMQHLSGHIYICSTFCLCTYALSSNVSIVQKQIIVPKIFSHDYSKENPIHFTN